MEPRPAAHTQVHGTDTHTEAQTEAQAAHDVGTVAGSEGGENEHKQGRDDADDATQCQMIVCGEPAQTENGQQEISDAWSEHEHGQEQECAAQELELDQEQGAEQRDRNPGRLDPFYWSHDGLGDVLKESIDHDPFYALRQAPSSQQH